MSTDATRKIEDQIEHMLRKAEHPNTPPAEAELCMARAEKLMIRHGIDQAVLTARATGDSVKAESIVRKTFEFKGVYAHAELQLGWAIINGLGLSGAQSKYRHFGRIYIVGYESDVECALQILASLTLQLKTAARKWWAEPEQAWKRASYSEHYKFIELRTFRMAFADRVMIRLMDQRRTSAAEAEIDTPGTGLVLRDRGLAVKEAFGSFFPDLRTEKRGMTSTGSYEARNGGRSAADKVDTGATRIGRESSARKIGS